MAHSSRYADILIYCMFILYEAVCNWLLALFQQNTYSNPAIEMNLSANLSWT